MLAVFLPMLFLSSLHVHPVQQLTADGECTECVHHQCDGHLGQLTSTTHDCVLCQFLTLPLLLGSVVAFVLINSVHQLSPSVRCAHRTDVYRGSIVSRGPPVC